jgi:hypothetical protein
MAKDFEMRFEEGLQLYDEAIDRAEEDLIHIGLPLPARPSDRQGELLDMPQLPEELTGLSPRELGDLLNTFSRWFEYATSQYKLSRGRRNGNEKKRGYAWSHIRLKKSGTVSDKDDHTRTDVRYMNVDADFEYTDAKLGLLEGIVRGLERDIETISRAITVMDQRLGVEGRGAAVASRRRQDMGDGGHFQTARRGKDVMTKFRSGRNKQ